MNLLQIYKFRLTFNNFIVHKLSEVAKESNRRSCLPLFCSCFKKSEAAVSKIDVLKNSAIFRGEHLRWSLCLIKLQACNFPVNIEKFCKNSFFHKTPQVAASEKIINFPGKHRRRRNRFIFLTNTTEKIVC